MFLGLDFDKYGWNLATATFDVFSVLACLALLLRYSRPSFLLLQIRSLALVDIFFHVSQCIDNLYIATENDLRNTWGLDCLLDNIISCIFHMSRHISVLHEAHIAVCCLCSTMRYNHVLRYLGKAVPLLWVLGICLGIPDARENKFVKIPETDLCGAISYWSIMSAASLGVSGIICLFSYAGLLIMARKASPQSVARREVSRLAVYPLNFLVTYGLVMVTYGVKRLPMRVWNIAFFLESLGGLLNVSAYTLQVFHQKPPVAFEKRQSMIEFSFVGQSMVEAPSEDSTMSSSGLAMGAYVELQEGARQFGLLAAQGIGIIVKYDAIRSEFMLVKSLQGRDHDWYNGADLVVVNPGTRTFSTARTFAVAR